ncbi:glycoside hydrolase [Thozetella sp. PMI_491]|nr:glycoside hydrolase [Thozetella sp. PMI_491]
MARAGFLLRAAAVLLASVGQATSASVRRAGNCTSHASDKLVFAHFMIGIVGDRTDTSAYVADMQRAREAGIDAFALNCGTDSYTGAQLDLAYQAAAEIGFSVFISFDFSWWKINDTALLGEYIANYAARPAQLFVDGKAYVSSYNGNGMNVSALREDTAAAAQANGAAGLEVYFAPNFYPPALPWISNNGNTWVNTSDGLDAALNWYAWPNNGNNKAPTPGHNVTVEYGDQVYLEWLEGKPYLAPVSPWFFTHYGPEVSYSKNFAFPSDTLMFDRLSDMLELQPQFFELVTWNDFGESHYLAPLDSQHGDDGNSKWTLGLPHEGWLDMAKPFIAAYKAGASKEQIVDHIEEEQIVYWYRPNPTATNCDLTDTTAGRSADNSSGNYFEGRPNGYESFADEVFVVSLLKEAGTLSVSSGNSTQTFSAPAGAQIFRVPMGLGTQSFSLSRDGQSVFAASSDRDITDKCQCGNYNFNAYVGTVPAKPWNDLQAGSQAALASGLVADVSTCYRDYTFHYEG